MPSTTSRVPSRVPSRRASRAASITSQETVNGPVNNISFVSHVSALGRGVGGGANLEDIAAAAAIITGGEDSTYADTLREEVPAQVRGDHYLRRRGRGGSSSSVAPPRTSGSTTDSAVGAGSTASAAGGIGEGEDAVLAGDVSTWVIAKQFLLVGYPLTLSTLSQFSLNTVIVSVNGKMLGDVELGGASLAVGLVNATGFAFGAGLCGALETVLSHTYGAFERETQRIEAEQVEQRELADQPQPQPQPNSGSPSAAGRPMLPPGITFSAANSVADEGTNDGGSSSDGSERGSLASVNAAPPWTLYMYGIYTQRMCVILFIVAFPLGIILCFADLGLQQLGESSDVLYYTGVWCRYAVFGIPVTLAYQLVQRYFSCQSITKPLSVAMVTAALLNPVLQVVFVLMFGYAGSPIAWLLLMTGIVAGLIGYMRYTGLHKFTWGGWSEKSLQNLGSLTAIAVPSMGVMLSEWVAIEINALAAGFAPTDQLAAFSITLQVFGIMWGIGSGIVILSCVFVGNAVGAGKPLLARRIAFIALGMTFCIALLDVLLMWSLGPIIPWLFTSDPNVVAIYHRLMYLVFPYHIFDTFQSTVMGILRGCELQKLGAIIISVAFCVVGIPTSFTLFFYFKIGVKALWIGPFLGVAGVGTPSYIYILTRYIKWEKLEAHTEDSGIPLEEEDEEGAKRPKRGPYDDDGFSSVAEDDDDGVNSSTLSRLPVAAEGGTVDHHGCRHPQRTRGAAGDTVESVRDDPLSGAGAHLNDYVDESVRQTQKNNNKQQQQHQQTRQVS